MTANTEVGQELRDLTSILSDQGEDFLLRSNGNKVPISDLEGKIVFLYFQTGVADTEFMKALAEVYNKLKERGESIEIIMVPYAGEFSSFELDISRIYWLAIPLSCEWPIASFFSTLIPSLVVIGSDGKSLNQDAASLVELLGVDGFPFTPEKFEAILEAQTLESLLVSGECDYVIGKGSIKVPVSDLAGKNILLYFWTSWCLDDDIDNMVETYQKIKARDSGGFELVIISCGSDKSSFDEMLTNMPWLAIPFGDKRERSLFLTCNVGYEHPLVVAISPTGKIVSKEVLELINSYGHDAYPFTEERIEEMAKEWPQKVKRAIHSEHELVKTRYEVYLCGMCSVYDEGYDSYNDLGYGSGWCFSCEECDFNLHPLCALDGDRRRMEGFGVEKILKGGNQVYERYILKNTSSSVGI